MTCPIKTTRPKVSESTVNLNKTTILSIVTTWSRQVVRLHLLPWHQTMLCLQQQLLFCKEKARTSARFNCANFSPAAEIIRATYSWLCWGAGNGQTQAHGKPPQDRRVLPRSCDTGSISPERLSQQTQLLQGERERRRARRRAPSSDQCGRQTPLCRLYECTYSHRLAMRLRVLAGFEESFFLLLFFFIQALQLLIPLFFHYCHLLELISSLPFHSDSASIN